MRYSPRSLLRTFRATEVRVLRSALSSFYDMSQTAVRALAEFDETPPR